MYHIQAEYFCLEIWQEVTINLEGFIATLGPQEKPILLQRDPRMVQRVALVSSRTSQPAHSLRNYLQFGVRIPFLVTTVQTVYEETLRLRF